MDKTRIAKKRPEGLFCCKVIWVCLGLKGDSGIQGDDHHVPEGSLALFGGDDNLFAVLGAAVGYGDHAGGLFAEEAGVGEKTEGLHLTAQERLGECGPLEGTVAVEAVAGADGFMQDESEDVEYDEATVQQ